jgi:hypothetical protein
VSGLRLTPLPKSSDFSVGLSPESGTLWLM